MALGMGLTLIGGAWAASASPRNGTWSVQMVTDSGLCDRSYSYSIAIENGNVRYLLAPGDSPTGSGRVSADGRLNGRSGSGTWQLGMLGCPGRWTAQKRSETIQS